MPLPPGGPCLPMPGSEYSLSGWLAANLHEVPRGVAENPSREQGWYLRGCITGCKTGSRDSESAELQANTLDKPLPECAISLSESPGYPRVLPADSRSSFQILHPPIQVLQWVACTVILANRSGCPPTYLVDYFYGYSMA